MTASTDLGFLLWDGAQYDEGMTVVRRPYDPPPDVSVHPRGSHHNPVGRARRFTVLSPRPHRGYFFPTKRQVHLSVCPLVSHVGTLSRVIYQELTLTPPDFVHPIPLGGTQTLDSRPD